MTLWKVPELRTNQGDTTIMNASAAAAPQSNHLPPRRHFRYHIYNPSSGSTETTMGSFMAAIPLIRPNPIQVPSRGESSSLNPAANASGSNNIDRLVGQMVEQK